MKVMMLAAGKGERMLPLTRETPKPLLLAGGKSLLEHQVTRLAACGFTDLVINHAWLGDQLVTALGDGTALGVNITWSEEDAPLETAGGIIQALPLLDSNAAFICVNADIWTDYPFHKLPVQAVDGNEIVAWLVLVENPEHHPQGDFVLSQGKVCEPGENDTAFTFSGIAVYHPALFEGVPPGKQSVVPLLKAAMANGKVGGELYLGHWFDIGTPERLSTLDQFLTE